MKIPRILFTAGSSGSGKTLITCGVLQALINRGLKPASFKCGPDYIDPMFHTRVLGTHSRNLDTFFSDYSTVRYLLQKNAQGCDISVMEGVMGYYDGLGGVSTKASTYEVARATDTTVILIVNGKGVSSSLAATVKGFKEFREDSRISGVIINHIKPAMYSILKGYIEEECGIPVVGYMPEVDDVKLESRHLGLVMPHEIQDLKAKLMKLASVVEECFDLDRILEIAENTSEISEEQPVDVMEAVLDMANEKISRLSMDVLMNGGLSRTPVAVAMDEAFCFMYEDNLELLKDMGAEIIPFSPMRDRELPKAAKGLILYGGYPELFLKELSENRTMIESIKEAYEKGMPILAECGGFMYLNETVRNEARDDVEGKDYPQVGIISGKAYKTDRLGRFGYVNLFQNDRDNCEGFFDKYGNPGRIPAHEFHYCDSTECGNAFHASKPVGKRGWDCIISEKNLLAGFPHIYYYGNPKVASAFLKKCMDYSEI